VHEKSSLVSSKLWTNAANVCTIVYHHLRNLDKEASEATVGTTPPPSSREGKRETQSTSALLALPLLALFAYLAAMIPFAVFLAIGWDLVAVLEPLAVLLVFNILVRRYFP
jgi:hypothetical protein